MANSDLQEASERGMPRRGHVLLIALALFGVPSSSNAPATRPGRGCPEADSMRREGRLDQAADAYKRCLSESPSDTAVMNNLGVSLAALGRHDEAISTLQRAIKLLPSLHTPNAALASSLSSAGRCSEAPPHLLRALLFSISPSDSSTRHSYASWLLESIEECAASVGPWGGPGPGPGHDVLGGAVGHHAALHTPEVWLRAASLLVNWGGEGSACAASRSFR